MSAPAATAASLSERLGGLSPRRLELLRAQLKRQGLDLSRLQVIPRLDHADGAPLSFAQQRLWLLDQLEPDGTAYNLPLSLQILGALDPGALAGALRDVARRHEVLRTTFPAVAGRPVQRIHREPEFSLPVLDLSVLPEALRGTELSRLRREEALRRFDLARGPLLWPQLVRLGAHDHVLRLTMHHIVSDHWSMGILVREIAAHYVARIRGEAPRLRALPVQYADFAAWQRRWLEGEELDRLLAYWTGELAGAPTVLELPADRPRTAARTGRGAYRNLDFTEGASDALRPLCQELGATPFMALLALFGVLIHRYTAQTDFLIGTPVANRNREEIEGLIGFFVNSLVLRLDLSGGPTFRELVSRVRQRTVDAYTHEDLPFERLVEALRPDRSRRQNPLFQVVLAYQDAPEAELELPGIALRALGAETVSAPFELTLSLAQRGTRLLGNALYDADLFDPATLARLSGHLRELLAAAATRPGAPVAELPMQTAPELHQLLVEANDTRSAYPEKSVSTLFSAFARERPEAIALVFGAEELSYGELDRRSDRLAAALARLGFGGERRVGIAAERSCELVTCLLAVLKAGGAFVPLDPAYPLQRLEGMIADARVELLLGYGSALDQVAACAPAGLLVIDGSAMARRAAAAPLPRVDCDRLAYVMFTSGTTGRPKAVGVTHRNIVRLVRENRFAHLGPDEVFLQLAPTSFDASTLEIWGALLHGGRLVVMPSGAPSLRDLGRALVERQVTTLWLTAGLFHQMVDAELDSLRGVRQLIAGGDTLSPSHVRRVLDAIAGCRVVNGYGPTENTTFTCCHDAATTRSAPSVPIGRPIAGTIAFVLDRQLRPMPIGVPGELFAGGSGLARGYLNAPDLTAEKMVPDPVGGVAGGRLYRTGDLVRWLPDGRLEFLGRIDLQVKIRGFRVEVEEVEEAIRRHPAVQGAVVLVRQDDHGEKSLAAYVVALPGARLAVAELRGFVRESLPEPMVPTAVVAVPELPLTANGKVDRRALASLGVAPTEPERPSAAREALPQSPVVELLAEIWSEVLAVESVGPHDDFFDLGGHSLKATQVVSRIRKVFGIEIELRSVFEQPTIAALAGLVEAELDRGERRPELLAAPIPRDRPLALSFAQQRLWFLAQLEPDSAAYNVCAHIRLVGPLDAGCLAAALDELVRRHESLRTSFVAIGGEPFQVVSPPTPLPLPRLDLSALPPAAQRGESLRLARRSAADRFDLGRGGLLRIWLVRCTERNHLVLSTVHHIVSDGWSMGVLVREIATLYQSFRAGAPSPLPALRFQYADFAAWQRSWLDGEVLEAALAWWRDRLAGAPALLELPTDRPREAAQSYRGRNQSWEIPPELATALRQLGRREGSTLFMTLTLAFQLLLGRLAQTLDVSIGTPIAGRNRLETEGLIGFFVNTLVIRAEMYDARSVVELLGRTRDNVLGAYAHQDVPFEKLVEAIQPERSLSFSPLFQVLFTLQNMPEVDAQVGDLQMVPFDSDTGTAKFDLALDAFDADGRVNGSLEYATDLFDDATVRRWYGHWLALLEGIVADPGSRIEDLPLIRSSERHQVTVEWNDTRLPRGQAVLLALLDRQLQISADAIAAQCGDEHLSYAGLHRLSERLADGLMRQGVGTDSVVGLLAERGLPFVIAILGIFRAGGAYLPLDPEHPARRWLQVLTAARSAHVVAAETWREPLGRAFAGGATTRPALLGLEGLLASGGFESFAFTPDPIDAPDQLAYVIFTSGSTGVPKGAMVHRGGLHNHLLTKQEELGLTATDVVAQTASQCFDISVWQFLAALTVGARVAIFSDASTRDPLRLIEEVRAAGVTVLELVPSFMRLLVEEMERCAAGDRSIPALRWFMPTGEALPPELGRQWLAVFPEIPLVNAYGPSECSDDVSFHVLRQASAPEVVATPIGRPLGNTRLYILDLAFRPVPMGVGGEIFVGGTGVGRGYLNEPGRTAVAFLPDSFAEEPGLRMYRTGDLARFLPAGELVFLGRRDHQVKVRGFRIELGEIEAVLGQCADVRDVLVVPHGESAARILVAYLTLAPGSGEDATSLKEALRQKLPEYMVPSVFMILDRMPLSANGKLDRKALPAPTAASAEAVRAPRTPVEEILAGIWCGVLGLERVGVESSFFELGGHSLLATQVMSRLRRSFGVELPLRALFESPTIEALAQAVERARRSVAGRVAAPEIAPRLRTGPPRLSFAQQRLWFLSRLEPGSAAYNIPEALRIEGNLAVPVLARALAEVVRRHEALRTSFDEVEGEPLQLVVDAVVLPLPQVDLLGLPAPVRDAEVARRTEAEVRRPFDLARLPLLRTTLLRTGAEEYAALFTMHHIVSDGWSMQLLVEEVGALYAALVDGRPSPLPELTIHYADYAEWQRGWLSGETLDAELDVWRARLAGLPPLLEMPTDRPRPAVQTHRGAVVPIRLDADLSARLLALGRRTGSTPFMTLLAGWVAFLGRYADCEDLAVGSPIAGRNREETERLIGFFVNTLLLRADLSGAPGFEPLLERIRQVSLEAHEHQDVPFERLVEELAPERSLAHSPLFQVLFVFQNVPERALDLPGLRLAPLAVNAQDAKFDLTLGLAEEAGRVYGSLNFNTDLFDPATAQRMIGCFAVLLAGAVAEPDRSLAELSLLSPAQREQLAVDWNDTGRVAAGASCLHELFDRQASRTPGATAVIGSGERWSYAELRRRANRIAHRLRAQGVGPEVVVGVCLERGPGLVAALLGVLKAGGAYLPLDSRYPAARLAGMLGDAGAPVVLGESALAEALPEGSYQLSLLDASAEVANDAAKDPDSDPEPSAGAGNVAYLIYTSGSTGRPKGVAIEHRSAVALVGWAAEVFPAEDLAGVLAATSISFDLSVFELFVPLALGGTVIVARDALALVDLPEAGEVRLVNTVPSAIAELVRIEAIPSGVRTVNLAGEALARELVTALHAAGVERVFNLYGPSEDTTYSTVALMTRGAAGPPPIGRPLTGTRAWVVDRRGNLVPVGVPGELYLSGQGLARGYVGLGDATAGRFVPEPWSGEPGERMYRTGDLVRWKATGDLEFLGRLDHQVKIRGFRIELGEIETVLRHHPAVLEAVVLARGAGGDRALVAFAAGDGLVANELRAHLRRRLPEHMVPSSFVLLDQLPLLPNGKVDRKALLRPRQPTGREDASDLPPRGPLQELMARIWAEVLRRERVGVEESFFDLGGHSLLATRVVARIRKVFGIELPVRVLFEAPTVAGLVRHLESLGRAERGTGPPLVPVPRDRPLVLSFAQQRLWFLDQLEPGPAYNMPTVLGLPPDLSLPALSGALRELVRRHEVLRTVFAANEGTAVQVIRPDAAATVPFVALSALPVAAASREARRLARREALRPFDLSRGPLLRAAVLRTPGGHVLLATMHHIVSDGWSLEIMERELTALYAACRDLRPSPLPELPVQYADYAAWQRTWLAGPVLDEQLAYWRRQLSGAPALVNLPLDRRRPAIKTLRGARLPVRLPDAVSGGLRALARREQATLFMSVLAGFAALLSRYGANEDLSLGTPVAGRSRVEVESLIGLFVNTLVLRLELAGDLGTNDLVSRVRSTVLAAHAHQDLPFERLVEELQPERSLGQTPLFQVMFDLTHRDPSSLQIAERSGDRQVEKAAANFDLSLSMSDDGASLSGHFEYSTDLFDDPTIERMTEHFERVLAAAVAEPDRPVSELRLLTAEERHHLLVEGNGAERSGEPAHDFLDLFAVQVAERPDAVAIEQGDAAFSYAWLSRRAARLALDLGHLGVALESRVGLHLKRSPAMVVAILGALAAGGAYVPIDPRLPAECRRFLVDDAGISFLIVGAEGAEDLAVGPLPMLRVAETPSAEDPKVAFAAARWPELAACVFYTSGSTGRPKGVVISRGALSGFVAEAIAGYRLGPHDRMLQFASPSFDASIEEIFGCLGSGGTLVLRSEAMAGSISSFVGGCAERGVTLLDLPVAFWHEVVHGLAGAGEQGLRLPPSVRITIVGGDQVDAGDLEFWHRLEDPEVAGSPTIRLINSYGPTEATVGATEHDLSRSPRSGLDPVPIGRPIRGVRAFVLDRHLEICPPGVVGDLWLGGAGLARGYFGRPELTAERFVPDPFSDFRGDAGARLYRTGDLSRRLAGSGDLVFLGRADRQVKLRGFLPLTPSGKNDCKALELRTDASPEAASRVPPRDLFELRIASLFEELLGVGPIGAQDDFFDLGGHSLLAVRLVARMRRETDREVPLAALFKGATVEKLAALLRSRPEDGRPASALVEIRAGRPRPFFCIHPVGGSVLCYADLARRLDRQVYGLQALPATTGAAPSLEQLAARYLAEVRAVQPQGPYALGGWSMGGVIAFEMARQLALDGERVAPLVLVDAHAPDPEGVPEPLSAAEWVSLFVRDLGGLAGRPLAAPAAIPGESAEEFLARAHEQGVAAGLVPPDFGAREVLERFQLFRANAEALAAYRGRRHHGPLLLLRAAEASPATPTDLGWGRLTDAPIEVFDLPADHYSIVRPPSVERLASRIAASLGMV